MKLSIFIPVFNQSQELSRSLRALIPEKDAHEIYVIDRGSSDGSQDLAASYDWVKVLNSDQGMLSATLNDAAVHGDGEALLFLQPGAIPARGWSAALESFFSKGPAAGHLQVKEENPESPWSASLRSLFLKGTHQVLGGPAGLSGIAVTRSLFADINGFREVPEFEWLAFVDRVKEAGATAKAIPHEVLMTPAPGAEHRDLFADIAEDFSAALRFRKTQSFDAGRSRRKSTIAVLIGYDALGEVEGSELFKEGLDAVNEINLRLLQSYRYVEKVFYIGGPASTAALGQPSGVALVGSPEEDASSRLKGLLAELGEKVDGLLLLRGLSRALTQKDLQKLADHPKKTEPCQFRALEGNEAEWLVLWSEEDALEILREADLNYNLAEVRALLKTRQVRMESYPALPAITSEADARALYFSGILSKKPA